MTRAVDRLLRRGVIGGRTVQIVETGAVECHEYPVAPLADGWVRVRTVRSAISPGTEMTFYGRDASNVFLHKHWDKGLRLFVAGQPSAGYPLTFGYRSAGKVVESRRADVPVGTRLFGSWRHTEFHALPARRAAAQRLPDGLSWDDGVDLAQMGPICVNAVAIAEGEHVGGPAVVFGAGPVGLITAQVVRGSGSHPVYVVDRVSSRLDLARSLGFAAIDASDADVALGLKTEHGSEGIAVAFECTGSTFALNEAIRTVRRRGTVIGVGFYQGEGRGLFLGDEFHHNGIRVICGQIGNLHPSMTRPRLRRLTIKMALAGTLALGGLPRRTLPVERAAEAFELLRHPEEVLQVALSYGA